MKLEEFLDLHSPFSNIHHEARMEMLSLVQSVCILRTVYPALDLTSATQEVLETYQRVGQAFAKAREQQRQTDVE